MISTCGGDHRTAPLLFFYETLRSDGGTNFVETQRIGPRRSPRQRRPAVLRRPVGTSATRSAGMGRPSGDGRPRVRARNEPLPSGSSLK